MPHASSRKPFLSDELLYHFVVIVGSMTVGCALTIIGLHAAGVFA